MTDDYFVIRYDSGKTRSYFDCLTAIGPKFGVTKAKSFRFATRNEAANVLARMTPLASIYCEIEKVRSKKAAKK